MENQKREITLGYLWEVFKRSLVVMIIAAIILGALGAVYAAVVEKPKYRATATFFVNNTTGDADYTSTAQTGAASDVANACVELATQDKPIRAAVEKHGLTEKLGYENDDACVQAVKGMVSAYKKDSASLIFYISVTSETKNKSYETMSAIQSVIPSVIEDLYGLSHETDRGDFVRVIGEVRSENDVATVKTSPLKLAVIMAFVAVIVVYVVYFIITVTDTSVYGEATIKENFDYPVIGNIPTWYSSDEEEDMAKPKFGKRKIGPNLTNYEDKLLVHETPFFVTEAFNALRTNMIFSAVAAKNPIFVITGDSAGVGKTVIATNLSLSIANLGKRVLLVECDMRCPALHKVIHERREKGLSELLAGMVQDSEEVIHKYKDTELDMIFCGQIPPNPSELLSGYRMTELAEEWKKKYDYIILDMPPIGEITDAGVVSGIVNGYLLAVRCNYSNVKDLKIAVDRLNAVNGNILGVIVNDVNPKAYDRVKKYHYKSYFTRRVRHNTNNNTTNG